MISLHFICYTIIIHSPGAKNNKNHIFQHCPNNVRDCPKIDFWSLYTTIGMWGVRIMIILIRIQKMHLKRKWPKNVRKTLSEMVYCTWNGFRTLIFGQWLADFYKNAFFVFRSKLSIFRHLTCPCLITLSKKWFSDNLGHCSDNDEKFEIRCL